MADLDHSGGVRSLLKGLNTIARIYSVHRKTRSDVDDDQVKLRTKSDDARNKLKREISWPIQNTVQCKVRHCDAQVQRLEFDIHINEHHENLILNAQKTDEANSGVLKIELPLLPRSIWFISDENKRMLPYYLMIKTGQKHAMICMSPWAKDFSSEEFHMFEVHLQSSEVIRGKMIPFTETTDEWLKHENIMKVIYQKHNVQKGDGIVILFPIIGDIPRSVSSQRFEQVGENQIRHLEEATRTSLFERPQSKMVHSKRRTRTSEELHRNTSSSSASSSTSRTSNNVLPEVLPPPVPPPSRPRRPSDLRDFELAAVTEESTNMQNPQNYPKTSDAGIPSASDFSSLDSASGSTPQSISSDNESIEPTVVSRDHNLHINDPNWSNSFVEPIKSKSFTELIFDHRKIFSEHRLIDPRVEDKKNDFDDDSSQDRTKDFSVADHKADSGDVNPPGRGRPENVVGGSLNYQLKDFGDSYIEDFVKDHSKHRNKVRYKAHSKNPGKEHKDHGKDHNKHHTKNPGEDHKKYHIKNFSKDLSTDFGQEFSDLHIEDPGKYFGDLCIENQTKLQGFVDQCEVSFDLGENLDGCSPAFLEYLERRFGTIPPDVFRLNDDWPNDSFC